MSTRPEKMIYDVNVYDDGTEVFYYEGMLHREDGACITKYDKDNDITEERYYFHGMRVETLDELLQLVKEKYGEK